MAIMDDLLAEVEAQTNVRQRTERLLLRQDLATRHGDLVAEWERAIQREKRDTPGLGGLSDIPPSVELGRQLLELENEMEAAERSFTFKSIGARKWADLLRDHPPTKEERIVGMDHHPETFQPAVVAACSVDPVMSFDEVVRFREAPAVSHAMFERLWLACVELNRTGGDVPKSLAAGVIRQVNAQSERRPITTGSPDPSSSDV